MEGFQTHPPEEDFFVFTLKNSISSPVALLFELNFHFLLPGMMTKVWDTPGTTLIPRCLDATGLALQQKGRK